MKTIKGLVVRRRKEKTNHEGKDNDFVPAANPNQSSSIRPRASVNPATAQVDLSTRTVPSLPSLYPSVGASALSPISSGTLWKDAYDRLRQKEPGLVQSFELELGAGFDSQKQIEAVVEQRLASRDEKQWIIKLASKPVKIREHGERVIKFALWSKDFVSSALATQPHLALAWTGVTLLLPVRVP